MIALQRSISCCSHSPPRCLRVLFFCDLFRFFLEGFIYYDVGKATGATGATGATVAREAGAVAATGATGAAI